MKRSEEIKTNTTTKQLDELMKQWKELHNGQSLLYRLIDHLQSEKDKLTVKIKELENAG